VVPHILKWHQKLAASLIYGFIRALAFTLRFRWEYNPDVLAGEPKPVIFCAWHNRLALALLTYTHYAQQRRQPKRLAAIVSASKDGGMVARILEHFGVQPVRGSSSRRGSQALLELTTWAGRGYDLAITPDGPRGPRYTFQPGAIALARLTGGLLIPSSINLSWKICLRSWDRFQIPLPFSRVVVKFGQPLRVPQEITESERLALRQELEKRLMELTVD